MLRCVIVGAGVAGCIVARELAQLPDVEVICLEQVSASDHSESGTGLNIGPNALLALREHDGELHDAVRARSFAWLTWRISLTDGTELFRLPLSEVADNSGIRIRWSELYIALRNEARTSIRYDVRVVGVEPNESRDHRLTVNFEQAGAHGSISDVDLLIAGDGRYSLTRSALSGPPPIEQFGVAIFRLLVPDSSRGLIDDYEQWFNGPNRLLAFRVPGEAVYVAGTFPIEPGAPIPDKARDPAWLSSRYAKLPSAIFSMPLVD